MSHSFSLGPVYVELPPAERFAQFLQGRRKRLTPQRQIIVEQVFSHHDHFDADELLEHLRDWIGQGKLSRPTVYRTLAELVEAGMLRQMTLSGRSIYEHEYGYPRHDHLYCQVCNRLIEFHSGALERLCTALAREYQFQVTGHRMFVMGICDQCRNRSQAVGTEYEPRINTDKHG
jgi:Fur family ferric uptake transcriptional regulator